MELPVAMAYHGYFKTGRVLFPLSDEDVVETLKKWASHSVGREDEETKLAKAGWFRAMPYDRFDILSIRFTIGPLGIPVEFIGRKA